MGLSGHQSARMKNDEWLTPPEIVRALGDFDLDPCAPVIRPWDTAANHYTIQDDGLSKKWFGRVWLNPPFGNQAIHWVARLAEHGNGIALLAARTETKLFFDHVWPKFHSIMFLRGRPHFHYVDGRRAAFNSGAPICLVAYGWENTAAFHTSKLDGHLIRQPDE